MLEEVWKDVPGYEGLYQISNIGRLKGKYGYRINKPNKYGYIVAALCKNGVTKKVSVHKLVAICFIDKYKRELDVDHINGVRHDNRLENLRVCTRSENLRGSKKRSNSSSKYKGVSYVVLDKTFEAFSTSTNQKMKKIHLGRYKKEEDAAIAVDKYVRQHYGEYGRYNFPQEGERGIN